MSKEPIQEPLKYEVGYGRPPKHARFKTGQSGNPNGRPKESRSLGAQIDKELDQTIDIQEAGRRKKLKKQVVFIKALVNKAVKGDLRAAQFIVTHSQRLRAKIETEIAELDFVDQLILDEFVKSRRAQ